MTDETPTLAEVWRLLNRIDRKQENQNVSLNERLDKMLTAEGLASHLRVHEAELRRLREDQEEFEKKAEIRFERHESKMTSTVRWAIGAVIAGAGVIIATIGQFVQAASGG